MLQLSYSQINLFKNNPLDYFYRYVLKLPEKNVETKWMDFGKGVHEVLEEYFSGANMDWNQNCIDKYDKYNLQGKFDFNKFKKNVINGLSSNINPTEIEKKVLISVSPKVTILGYIDVYSDKEDYIIDWKTGTYSKDKENTYKNQLICYAWFFWKINNRVPKECSLYFTEQNKKISFQITLDEIKNFEKELKEIANEILRKKALHKKAEQWGSELGFFSGYHYLKNLPKQTFKITIKNNFAYLSGSLNPLLINGLDKETYFDLPGKYFMQKAILAKGKKPKNIDEIGRVHLFNKRDCSFSIGLIPKIKELLFLYGDYKKIEIEIIEEDLRSPIVTEFKSDIFPEELITDKELRPYQLQAISSFFRSGGMGVLEVATGGGKTLITAEIVKRLSTSTLWIIDKKELLYQTKEVFEDMLGVEIGIIGDGEFNPKTVTVATIQTLYSKVKNDISKEMYDYLNKINFVIVDEFHHSAAESYCKVMNYIGNSKYRLGTTATARREDGKDPMMFSLVGPVIYSIKAEELIEQGYLMRPKIIFYELSNEVDKSIDYNYDYSENIVNNEERNNKIIDVCKENTHRKILILVKHIKHGEELNEKIDGSIFVNGQIEKNSRKIFMKSFKDCSEGVLITTLSIASEGLDIPDLDMVINASANKSDVKSTQILGRILRKIEGKKDAVYIDFIDGGKFGKKHTKRRISVFKDDGYEVEIK